MYFVSACLIGMQCRYNGGAERDSSVLHTVSGQKVLFGCPESLGGLPTPRLPSHITSGSGEDVLDGNSSVINEKGEDVTEYFIRGAETAYALIQKWNITTACLKSKSPSCGITSIKRNGCTIPGSGVTAALLKRYNIELIEI